MSFFHPHLLWLAALPALLLTWDLLRRAPSTAGSGQKILAANAGPAGVTLLKPNALRRGRVRWRLALGLTFAAIAVARPQWGRLEEPVFDQAREILVAIDLSRSMLADDVKPTRLDRARLLTQSLLENTPGERVGLVVFAGTAFLQSPLSADHEIIRDFLPELNPDFLPAGGTDYTALLKTALGAFSDSSADRFLVILSDGEAANGDWEKLVDQCKDRGVRILALGIGTHDGAMLPDGQGGLVKDERGAVVLSKLDDTTLRDIAAKTGGVYTDASQWVDLPALIDATVAQGKQGDFKETGRVRLAERYQWALAPALLILLWSFWREFPVRAQSRPVGRLRAASLALVLLGLGLADRPSARATEPTPPPASPALPDLVAKLATQPALSAADYAHLAQGTVDYAQDQRTHGQSTPPGALNDALQATASGRRLDPKAADWDQLEKTLRQLLQPPPEQKQQQQSKNQQQQSSKDQSQKSDSKDGQKGDSSQDKSSSQDPSKGSSGQSSDQSPGQSGEPKPSDQSEGQSSKDDPKPSGSSPDDHKTDNGDASSGQKPEDDKTKTGQSAFGDMNQTEPKPAEPKPTPTPGTLGAARPQSGDDDTQSVGGVATGQPETTDPALMQTLQRLEQIKTQDSPARLFQLLQPSETPPPAAATGQTW